MTEYPIYQPGDLVEFKLESMYKRGMFIIIEPLQDGDPYTKESYLVYSILRQAYFTMHRSSIKKVAD